MNKLGEGYDIIAGQLVLGKGVWERDTWRMGPHLGYVVRITPMYKPFRSIKRPFGRGPTTRSLGDLRSPWLLTTGATVDGSEIHNNLKRVTFLDFVVRACAC